MSLVAAYMEVKGSLSSRLNIVANQLATPQNRTLTSKEFGIFTGEESLLRQAIGHAEEIVDSIPKVFANFQTSSDVKKRPSRIRDIDDRFVKLTKCAQVFAEGNIDVKPLIDAAILAAGEIVERQTGYRPAATLALAQR